MKKLIHHKAALMTAVALFLCAVSASAHPPYSVDLAYNKTTREITVTVSHPTTTPDWHFVQKIEFLVGDTVIHEKVFTKQEADSGLAYTTRLRNIQSGDTVMVKAYCSRSGMKTASLVIDSTIDSTLDSTIGSTPDSTEKSRDTRRRSY
jgi:desulfoferrodoxin (superoxide reductase-like protein)